MIYLVIHMSGDGYETGFDTVEGVDSSFEEAAKRVLGLSDAVHRDRHNTHDFSVQGWELGAGEHSFEMTWDHIAHKWYIP